MSLIDKIANSIELSFPVPEAEQQEAREASKAFEAVINKLKYSNEHLNIIYDPFKKSQDLSPEAVFEFRGAIRRYKDQTKENFNIVKRYAFEALVRLNNFSSDTHIMELISSFKDSVEDVEEQVNNLLNIFDDLRDQSFKDNVISTIDEIRKKSDEVEKLINERIIDYIDSNIITKDWVSTISKDLKKELKRKEPFITQLFNERAEALKQK